MFVGWLQVFLAISTNSSAPARGKENWYKEYYMPTPCDGLVIAGMAAVQCARNTILLI